MNLKNLYNIYFFKKCIILKIVTNTTTKTSKEYTRVDLLASHWALKTRIAKPHYNQHQEHWPKSPIKTAKLLKRANGGSGNLIT